MKPICAHILARMGCLYSGEERFPAEPRDFDCDGPLDYRSRCGYARSLTEEQEIIVYPPVKQGPSL